MKVAFINVTQHNLTEDQRVAIKPFIEKIIGKEVIEIDIINLRNIIPELYDELKNISFGKNTASLAISLVDEILTLKNKYDIIFVHLPIGSPKFMFEFSSLLTFLIKEYGLFNFVIPVFSHTERQTIEKKSSDGSIQKVSVFKFNGYEIPDIVKILSSITLNKNC